ncbi:response regulator [Maribacter sp. 2307ULW6-5]|uniref:response regulator n=1 Tax=Maribacter sp. 2307ULW6-5 TaxID=3386275 RepID=UPI0039BD7254
MKKHFFRVMLVDDDEDDRFLFSEAFETLEVKSELQMCHNGQEFIDHLENNPEQLPEIVFLDLNMPIKNGLECLRYLKQHSKYNDIFVAIYSTSSAEKDMEDTLLAGANIYIQKPNNFQTLRSVIDRAMKTCYQYATSQLDRHSFLLKL